MDILICVAGLEFTDKLCEAIRSKIGRVRRYAPRALRARGQLQRSNPPGQYRTQVLYELKGNDVSAQHAVRDPGVALDVIAEKIERRLRNRKTAHLARRARDHYAKLRRPQAFARP
jgi:ribosomal subunit interface protein